MKHQPMAASVIRPAGPGDLQTLWEFLAMAAYEPDATAAKAVPMIGLFLNGWPRPGDFGFIAERDGVAIGASWARQFSSREESWFYIDERTPEISIGVREGARGGQGVGEMLLPRPDRRGDGSGTSPVPQHQKQQPRPPAL